MKSVNDNDKKRFICKSVEGLEESVVELDSQIKKHDNTSLNLISWDLQSLKKRKKDIQEKIKKLREISDPDIIA